MPSSSVLATVAIRSLRLQLEVVMDSDQFDTLITRLTIRQSRRRNLGLLTVLGLGAGLTRLEVDAKKKGKKKGKKKKKTGTTSPPATTPRPPVSCSSGLIPCTPNGTACCTPAEVVASCQDNMLMELCPMCQNPNDPNCSFCRPLVEEIYYPCCEQFAVSPGPAAVRTCMCDAGYPCD